MGLHKVVWGYIGLNTDHQDGVSVGTCSLYAFFRSREKNNDEDSEPGLEGRSRCLALCRLSVPATQGIGLNPKP